MSPAANGADKGPNPLVTADQDASNTGGLRHHALPNYSDKVNDIGNGNDNNEDTETYEEDWDEYTFQNPLYISSQRLETVYPYWDYLLQGGAIFTCLATWCLFFADPSTTLMIFRDKQSLRYLGLPLLSVVYIKAIGITAFVRGYNEALACSRCTIVMYVRTLL